MSPYAISQNFITSTQTIERMLRRTNLSHDDHVWEIGAGKGHITRRLVHRCGHVTAVEIDPVLCAGLIQRLGNTEGLRLIRGDFLTTRLPASEDYKVFSNIPFSRTTDIIRKLTTTPNAPVDTWLVVEKGAAKRFLGTPHDTIHSLLLKPFFELRIAYHLRREDFHPMPAVDCVLLHLHRREQPDIAPARRAQYESFLRGTPLTKRQAQVALRSAGLEEIPQSATMRYVQWLCLFRFWARLS